MIGTILGFILAVLITIWLVSVFSIMVVAIPVLMASSMLYVESGHQWWVWIPGAIIVAVFAWIDYRLG